MAKHEKHLLIGIVSFLLVGATWVMIGALVTGHSPVFLISGFFHSLIWVGLVAFFLIGLAGIYYEMTFISEGIQLAESVNESFLVTDEYALYLVIGNYLGFVLLGFVYGIDEAGILEGMHNVLLASLGFSIVLGMMFLGAVVARMRRERS